MNEELIPIADHFRPKPMKDRNAAIWIAGFIKAVEVTTKATVGDNTPKSQKWMIEAIKSKFKTL